MKQCQDRQQKPFSTWQKQEEDKESKKEVRLAAWRATISDCAVFMLWAWKNIADESNRIIQAEMQTDAEEVRLFNNSLQQACNARNGN
jgi:hypothetical protein